jgi:hypothetical protein
MAATEKTVVLTVEQIRILLAITGPRVASPEAPEADKYGDWSVDLDARLRKALES